MPLTRVCFRLFVHAAGVLAFAPAAVADELLDTIEVRSENGVCDVVLDAVIRTQPFPAAGAAYSLRAPVYVLRKANGKAVVEKPGESHLIGPTLRVKRGDLLKIRINNGLDRSLLPTDPKDAPEDYPQEFYATNLHTHGLHLSPAGTADNVFVTILPGEHHQYEYLAP
jgi:FtsP/CotA-like multicopper oxidase with cupredoxin domain